MCVYKTSSMLESKVQSFIALFRGRLQVLALLDRRHLLPSLASSLVAVYVETFRPYEKEQGINRN
jgi:hypothetical protein